MQILSTKIGIYALKTETFGFIAIVWGKMKSITDETSLSLFLKMECHY
jgi:hypothetical protein